MSNLLSLRNRNIKHYKNLSNHSVVDSETKDDLITELKNYRNSHSKPSSPYKLKTPTLKSQTLYSIDDTHEATTRFVRTTTNKQSKLRNYSKKTESVSLSLSENESFVYQFSKRTKIQKYDANVYRKSSNPDMFSKSKTIQLKPSQVTL